MDNQQANQKYKNEQQEINKKEATEIMERVINKYLKILPGNTLEQKDLDKFCNTVLETNLRFDSSQFINYLKLAKNPLINNLTGNVSKRFNLFDRYLNMLDKNVQFNTQQLLDILGYCCLAREYKSTDKFDLYRMVLPILSRLREKQQSDFELSSDNKFEVSFTILKAIANVSIRKDVGNKINKISEVLKQLTGKEIKITVQNLESIFQYYFGKNASKLDVWTKERIFDENTLNLLNLCVQVLSESEFKVQEGINNQKQDIKNNMDVNLDIPAIMFLGEYFTNSRYNAFQMGHGEIVGLIKTVLSSSNKKQDGSDKTEENKSTLAKLLGEKNNISEEKKNHEKKCVKFTIFVLDAGNR